MNGKEVSALKLLHLSDLHLGRRLHNVSLLEDQQVILDQILAIARDEAVDAVLLAGDVYDKPVPPVEAVALLDRFLTSLSDLGCAVLAISGNHDSPERLAFGSALLGSSRVYVAPVFEGAAPPVTLEDDMGPVRFYLLPFLKPVHVRRVYPEAAAETYTEAVETVVGRWKPDPAVRNVLIAHQLVTGAARSESELLSIGGLDNVDAGAFAGFDYVALGHLHRAQNVGPGLRYAGSPLAYAFSEGDQVKSVTLVELGGKGTVTVTAKPLTPLHPVRSLRGGLEELLQGTSEDYLRITLTDSDLPNTFARLQSRYPNLLKLEYAAQAAGTLPEAGALPVQSPLELLAQFYESRWDAPMSEDQRTLARRLMEEIWEDTL